jgi:GDPmannose 4,6-dehydratase
MGWKPQYDLAAMVKEMVASDLTLFKKDMLLMDAGHSIYVQQE